jgi:hypothetical protein
MEQWLVENMLWVGLGIGVFLVGIKYLIVYFYRKLAAADAAAKEQE